MVIDTVTTPTSRNHVGIGFECRLTLSMHKAHTKKKHVEGSLLPKRKDLVIAPSETKLTSNAAKSNATEIKFNKQTIYEKNKQLDRIKTEKTKYENLNNGIIAKINEVTQAIEEQRQRQVALLRRREMMMNYLMTMLMGIRRGTDDYPNVDNMSYEELLALEERMGNVNRGLPKEKFDKLPTEKFSKYKFKDDKCIICQYEFKANEMLKVLPCKHCFHPDCIEEWLKNQKACPYCKTEVKV